MGVSSSLYSSISGLSTMGEAMSVLGDNVANVNTVAFKSSRSTFQDVLAQSVSTAAGSAQVGRGVTLNAIDSLFAQGSFESSSTPTDMAIGGQGFFMLRDAGSATADMYSRAGEFRFDQNGSLVDPVGHFAQGWTIDTTTGERAGTIGDISIGKNTPPVATKSLEVIANVDSRKMNEANEDRLFANWNGTNVAAINPSDPIDSTKYDYTTSNKIYDSKGASHDISVYYDRTTNDNQWEFLVTCDPKEDLRSLTTKEKAIYNPDTRYNYKNDKGAGALMYGVMQFDTAGNVTSIDAYKVPPDGEVDPSKPDNRMLLSPGDTYFSFPTNFTGAATNQDITLNIGARYDGQSSNIDQVIVSDQGAHTSSGATSAAAGGSNYITTATLWSDITDAGGNAVSQGDTFILEGYKRDGAAVSGANRLVYTVDPSKDVQDFLTKVDNTFGGHASIDAKGRLVITDGTGGASALAITRFETISANQSVPFGGAHGSGNKVSHAKTLNPLYLDVTQSAVVTDTSKKLVDLYDGSAKQLVATDTLTFAGTDVNGVVPSGSGATYKVTAISTVQDLLNYMSDLYSGTAVPVGPPYVASPAVTTVLSSDGRMRVIDNSNGTNMLVNVTTAAASGATPWGITGVATDLATYDSFKGQVNVTTSKKELISVGRSSAVNTGFSAITANTSLDSVFADDGTGTTKGMAAGDAVTFTGTDRDGNNVSLTYTVGTPSTENVGDILNSLEDKFKASASIDGAGRLILTDWHADTVSTAANNKLAITGISYSNPAGTTVPRIFGTGAFDYIDADVSSEDGSQNGDTVTTGFVPEALGTTQYANSSTTIFQDQDGYASGFLQSVSTDVSGVITGHYSNGQVLKKAQVALANFSNLAGLRKEGGNIFTETTDSGAPVTGAPGTNGLGSIAPNALEQSNVDLGTEFVKLITVQRGFQANSKIITTVADMLNTLINIKR
ncbi:MAG: flagellar hook-basal body complex protein [Deltaproteobacteria bacterium]|nr:flagellar hook-basal body complex protein [Deltaproteobacteria bacterium]